MCAFVICVRSHRECLRRAASRSVGGTEDGRRGVSDRPGDGLRAQAATRTGEKEEEERSKKREGDAQDLRAFRTDGSQSPEQTGKRPANSISS